MNTKTCQTEVWDYVTVTFYAELNDDTRHNAQKKRWCCSLVRAVAGPTFLSRKAQLE